jgi:FtsP/CotA-like multicopper oxidase with cupredoxin domain
MTRDESLTRRRLLFSAGAGVGGALLLTSKPASALAETDGQQLQKEASSLTRATPGAFRPVVVPNGVKLPWRLSNGTKVFHMVAEEVDHEFAPGLRANCWGYNGSVHGPCIEAVEGDRVRIYVTNRLRAATSVHWHGVLLPNGMDGVGGLNQRAIEPGETFKYEFALRQHGTAMYHSHHDEMTQIGMGMTGLFIIHPRKPLRVVDRDYALLLHEWRINVGASRPNPNEMTDFNVLTMNAKVFPATEPLLARTGDRVRIRIGNLSPMSHHPIHLHGYEFRVTESGGGPIPEAAQLMDPTVLVPVGGTRTIEFVAHEPGDWAMHCHMTHHVMNQMGHQAPNMVGVDVEGLDETVHGLLPGFAAMGQNGMDPGMAGMAIPSNSIPMLGGTGKHGPITMGGMFTILKVRDHLDGHGDPGWYENPRGTLASLADPKELLRDGVDVNGPGFTNDASFVRDGKG